jgi:hypothetical protein
VVKLFAPRRRWGRRLDGPDPAYEVLCGCGQSVRGVRQARRQVVACPGCGRRMFILARSPLPAPDTPLVPAPLSARRPLGAWRWPLIAAIITLTILSIIFVTLVPFLGRPTAPPNQPDHAPDLAARAAAGRRALAEGDFHLAAQELQAALDEAQRRPDVVAPAERRDLMQLQRQSDLLSRLSSQSIQEIVKEADLVRHEDEWKARFESDYKGKTVVFDDVVRFEDAAQLDARRRPVLTYYRVAVEGREVRLALEDVRLLQTLARERPQRMLFGVRLSAIERGPGGQWVVRFDPDSGVLLTDRGAAEAASPTPPDAELLDVLKRQEEWVRFLNAPGY